MRGAQGHGQFRKRTGPQVRIRTVRYVGKPSRKVPVHQPSKHKQGRNK